MQLAMRTEIHSLNSNIKSVEEYGNIRNLLVDQYTL